MKSSIAQPVIPDSQGSWRLGAYWFGATLLAGYALGQVAGYADTLQPRWAVALYVTLVLMGMALFALRRVTAAIFYLFLFLLSFDLGKSFLSQPDPQPGIVHDVKLTIPVVLLFILALVVVIKTVAGRRRFKFFGQVTVPALLFIGLSILSIVKAPSPLWSVFELFRLVCGFLTYLIVANYIASYRPRSTTVVNVLMASLMLQAVFGIIQHFYDGPLGLAFFGEMQMDPSQWGVPAISRGGGLMGHPNALGALIIMFLPIAGLTAVFAEGWKLRFFAIFTTVISIIGLIFTYSRSAWLGCLIGTILIVPLSMRRLFDLSSTINKRRAKQVLLFFGLGLLVFLIMFATLIQERFSADDYGSASGRIPMMVDALDAIKHNYLLGVGLGNYSLVILKYDVTGIHREWTPTVVHDIFLLIAAETGPISLLVFAWFLFRVLRRNRDPLKLGNSITTEVLVIGAKCGMMSLLVFSTVEPAMHFYPGLQREFWCLVALITAFTEFEVDTTQSNVNRALLGRCISRGTGT